MEYIVIPSKSKSETAFLMSLLKKMQQEATTLSADEMEDLAFIAALKEAEKTSKGSLTKVKEHLNKIAKSK
jgi:hypothetical protein